jgi:hypothetical protein
MAVPAIAETTKTIIDSSTMSLRLIDWFSLVLLEKFHIKVLHYSKMD